LPVRVVGIPGIAAIAMGGASAFAIGSDATVWAWGDNTSGQLGFNIDTSHLKIIPSSVSGLSGATAFSLGDSFSMALKSDGTVWAWGANRCGQLGDGSKTSRSAPFQVPGLIGVVALATAGGDEASDLYPGHAMALKSDGSVWAWGDNSFNQLGDGLKTTQVAPVLVPGLSDVVAVAAGPGHSLAVKRDGSLWTWGSNSSGQLGDGTFTDSASPIRVPGISGVVNVTGGGIDAWGSSTLAVKSDGSLWAWGNNDSGQLGDGTTASRALPAAVPGMNGVVAVAAGWASVAAVKYDGSVWAWGDNWGGYLGDQTDISRYSPVAISGVSSVVGIAKGYFHTVALKSDGSVWTWGANWAGQLGDGTTNSRSTPGPVPGIGAVVAVAATDGADGSGGHSLALKADGSVWGWGSNVGGELGDGTRIDRLKPVRALVRSGIASIATAGLWNGSFSLALGRDGLVSAWGGNTAAALGDGTFAQRSSPVLVVNPTVDGFLSLFDSIVAKVATSQNIPFFLVGTGGISPTSASVATTTKFNPSDTGKPGSVYVTAMVPSGGLGTTPIASSPAPHIAAARPQQLAATTTCAAPVNPLTLIQLTPTGWQTVVNGQLIPYASGVLGDQLAAQTILSGTDTTNLKGAEFCVGYGTSAQNMIDNGNIRAVATIPGASTTSTCVVGGIMSVGLSVAPGWNLLGNPINQSMGVADKFGDASTIQSVWKWDAAKANWQFYTPSLNATDLLAYATTQGYGVLSEITAGDGYWVHAKVQADLGSLCGQAINLRQSSLSSGWNLVATASPIGAKDFNLSLSTTPPTAGQVPINLTSLWAWDNAASQWYFYAPVLDAQGGSTLADYLGAKSYKDFTGSGKTLGNGVGIWVNRP
jgi:alpha-tubulin suppressor-like RCC1 family protein